MHLSWRAAQASQTAPPSLPINSSTPHRNKSEGEREKMRPAALLVALVAIFYPLTATATVQIKCDPCEPLPPPPPPPEPECPPPPEPECPPPPEPEYPPPPPPHCHLPPYCPATPVPPSTLGPPGTLYPIDAVYAYGGAAGGPVGSLAAPAGIAAVLLLGLLCL